MSIQSTINQGISLVSLLVAQTPMVKKKEAEDAAARQEAISQASERGRQEGLQEARDKRAAQDLEEARRLYGEHSALVKSFGKGGPKAEKFETLRTHIETRQNAVASARRLQDFEPSQELIDQIGQWNTEIDQLVERQKYFGELGRAANRESIAEGQETRAAKRKKQREEAEASAAAAQEEEQRRQAITREITRPFDPTTDKFRW